MAIPNPFGIPYSLPLALAKQRDWIDGDGEGAAVSRRGLRRGWTEIGEDGGMSALAEVLRHANLERLMSAALRQNV